MKHQTKANIVATPRDKLVELAAALTEVAKLCAATLPAEANMQAAGCFAEIQKGIAALIQA